MSAKRGEAPDADSPEAVAAREKEAERKARHERSKRIAAERKATETAGRGARALRRRRRRRGARSAVLGHPRRQGRRGGRLHEPARRARAVPGPVGPARRARRRGPVVRGSGRDRRPPAAAVLAGPAVHRRHPRARRGGVRLLPRGVRGRRRHRAHRTENPMRRTVPVHVPAPAARSVPVHRGLHPVPRAGQRARPGGRAAIPAGDHGRSRSPTSPTSCSRPTPTATTSRCTASSCS